MSYKHYRICDLCGKEIKDTDSWYTVTGYPAVEEDAIGRDITIADVCNDCITNFIGFEAITNTKINCEEEQRSVE